MIFLTDIGENWHELAVKMQQTFVHSIYIARSVQGALYIT